MEDDKTLKELIEVYKVVMRLERQVDEHHVTLKFLGVGLVISLAIDLFTILLYF